MKYIQNSLLFLFLLLVSTSSVPVTDPSEEVADPILFLPASDLSLFPSTKNVMIDSAHVLDAVFESLAKLRSASCDTSPFVIVHLGDSHIQGGTLSGKIRQNFHQYFGNAGRGLISPYKLTRSNNPVDYSFESDGSWESERMITANTTFPIGVTGMTLTAKDKHANLSFTVSDEADTLDYSFNQIRFFPGELSKIYKPDSADDVPGYSGDDSCTWILKQKRHTLTFVPDTSCLSDTPTYFSGVSLENGEKGVLYHAIGVNGAHFYDYTNHPELFQQISLLKPNLIIISLGTNEAFGKNCTKQQVYTQLEEMVTTLQQANPGAKLLLTTPPEVYAKQRIKRKSVYVVNKKCKLVADVILGFGRERGIPVWDLFRTTGGDNSCKIWQKNHLLKSDRVHFTEKGYTIQADLFFQSFTDHYNEYLELRRR
ncbi:MAG: GDSL-type esterase/lipase family protein [Bacteroidales bacterium]|nr:GDSL-type esterase/lipase family protein [Bacteroidales bacterium]